MKIERVPHTAPAGDRAGDPAGIGLALTVARELHAPARRAPELAPAVSRPAPRRSSTRRRTVRS
ncbi:MULTISPECIES: hypothetical protein [unclassified Streptomyces]|jgi:hypothetical protein|uniref:hypothetical protein n=1 Tax=unclassified Streptomyces TaxID=2593676 RepID=UPI002E26FDAF